MKAFSRNDAIGNAGVFMAAVGVANGLVWSGLLFVAG
jgi:hypothetical protein